MGGCLARAASGLNFHSNALIFFSIPSMSNRIDLRADCSSKKRGIFGGTYSASLFFFLSFLFLPFLPPSLLLSDAEPLSEPDSEPDPDPEPDSDPDPDLDPDPDPEPLPSSDPEPLPEPDSLLSSSLPEPASELLFLLSVRKEKKRISKS